MRNSLWSFLHDDLKRQISTLAADQWWHLAARCFPELGKFPSPKALAFDYLERSAAFTDEELAVRDHQLACLVAIFQGLTELPGNRPQRPAEQLSFDVPGVARPGAKAAPVPLQRLASRQSKQLALATLMLCLWSGLSHILYKRKTVFADFKEAASVLSSEFAVLAGNMDLSLVSKVIACLLLSTERNIIRAFGRDLRAADLSRNVIPDAESVASRSEFGASVPSVFLCGRDNFRRQSYRSQSDLPSSNLDYDRHVERLETELRRIVGPDARLLVNVYALGAPVEEVAADMHLPKWGAHQRVQRAKRKVREHYAAAGMSQAMF